MYKIIVNQKQELFVSRGLFCNIRIIVSIMKWAACDKGEYGPNCEGTCHCASHDTCDPMSGYCDGSTCAPGWKGHPQCQTGQYSVLQISFFPKRLLAPMCVALLHVKIDINTLK